MPPLAIKKFKGYSSKKDQVFEDIALASNMENLIINNGDICNIPYPTGIVTHAYFVNINRDKRCSFYYQSDQTYLAVFIPNTYKLLVFRYINGIVGQPLFDVHIASLINIGSTDFGGNLGGLGNILQVGDWLFFIDLFGYLQSIDDTPNEAALKNPRMFKIKAFLSFRANGSIEFQHLQYGLIGLKQPSIVRISQGGGGAIEVRGAFAVTFITDMHKEFYDPNDELDPVSRTTALYSDDIESNATVPEGGDVNWITASQKTFKVYLPENYTFPEPFVKGIGVYFKKETETNYYFLTYLYNGVLTLSNEINEPSRPDLWGKWFVRYTLATDVQLTNTDITRHAPLGDIVPVTGAHDVPPPCYHAIYYKDRVYYAALGNKYEPQNVVHASHAIPLNDPNQVRYAQYIERQFPVGSDYSKTTGFCEFLGQLLIFKEDETWALSDDISVGKLDKLFNIGCSAWHGQGVINVNNTIYFWSSKGIYEYRGGIEPTLISEAIDDDLKELDFQTTRYVRLRADERYNLLYVMLPLNIDSPGTNLDQGNKTFIYNYKDKVWSKTSSNSNDSPLDLIVNTRERTQFFFGTRGRLSEIWWVLSEQLRRLGKLDEPQDTQLFTSNPTYKTQAKWKSGKIDLGDNTRRKHWKELRVISRSLPSKIEFNPPPIGSLRQPKSFLQPILKFGGDSKDYGFISQLNEDKFLPFSLKINTYDLQFELQFYTNQPIRISAMELDTHLRSRY